jgi:RND family efflux transporter MFP subunit
MNVETAKWRRQGLETAVMSEELIAQRRRRRNLIIAAVVALLVILAAAFFMMKGGDEAAPGAGASAAGKKGGESVPNVTVIVPGRQQVPRMITATGALAARVDMPVGVAGEGGMVARVLVEPGQWVGAGQTLAVIDRSVQSQEAQRLAAQIEVSRADARLAQQELDRAQSLVARGFVSRADVDRRTAARDAANARVRVAQAQLGESRARMGRLDVRAPAAGLILARNVEAGQIVSAGSGALFRVARGGEMEMLARLPEADLTRLSPGTQAQVTPVGSTQTYGGRIWQISPVIDPQSRQGEARIAIAGDRNVRPGGFATAQISVGAVDAPLLPESAVLNDEDGSYVYIVGDGNVVQRRPVKVGAVVDKGVVIAEGLSGSERIVLAAGAFLSPGEKIRPQRAASR